MAHLLRLIVAFVLLGLSLSASALVPQASGYMPGTASDGGFIGGTAYPTVDGACTAFQSFYNTQSGPYSAVYVGNAPFGSSGNSWQCYADLTNKSTGALFTHNANGYAVKGGLTCPANSAQVAGGCQCTAPYVENAAHTACEAPPDPCLALKGQSAGVWWKDTGDDNGLPAKVGFSVCDKYQSAGNGLCVVTVPSRTALCGQAEGGWWRCSGEGFYTGSTAAAPSKCSQSGPGGTGDSASDPMPSTPPVGMPPKAPDQPAPGTAAPAPCPVGQAPGTFNGTSMCKPVGTDRPQVADAPGNGDSTTNNSDGSSTTSTRTGTTKCAEGQCTTTTNVTNVTTNAPGNDACPSGQTPGTKTVNGQTRRTCTGTTSGTSSEAQSGFCEKNSKDKQCDGDGADTSFGGACAGGFKAVSDDAVLNAMAEEQYRRNCEFFEKKPDATDETRAYDAMLAKGKQGGDQTGDLPEGSKRDYTIGPSDFDYSSAIGSQQCFRDRNVSIWGRSIVIPLSVVCPWLEILGNILVVVGSLLAARIVVRG
ncbi:hypothetical protein CLU95_4084 [Variovorax sp. 54]|uniref:hypothetical protein n=1 Tax=Variovorax sp. 54 TaxID=2035212 RepID=UPI000C69CD1C|nr:hypothetical protein [Variovorax sp. 54]PIF76915.1 hypothetical protein CLU95_4084 [Variovorax sp. 54]